MTEGWQFTLNETSVHFLLALRARQRQQLIEALELLVREPLQRGDFEVKDTAGRSVQIKVVGPFLISFWADLFVRELRVIKIEWI